MRISRFIYHAGTSGLSHSVWAVGNWAVLLESVGRKFYLSRHARVFAEPYGDFTFLTSSNPF